jgi:hypothetical protein
MRVIRIQVDGKVVFVAQAADQRARLTRTHERALSFRQTYDDRDSPFPGGLGDGLQTDKV